MGHLLGVCDELNLKYDSLGGDLRAPLYVDETVHKISILFRGCHDVLI